MSNMSFLSQFWQDYGGFIINLLISSGAALAIIKFWLKARLKAVDHKYNEKIEILKSSLSKEITHQAAVYSSFSEGQKAAMERKLLAIDELWQTLIKFRDKLPRVLGMMDYVLEKEYKRAFLNNTVFTITKEDLIELDKIVKDIDKVRPYVGELMWFLFCSYSQVFGKISILIHLAQEGDADKIYWKKDSVLRNVLDSLLTKEEMENFNNLELSNIWFLKQKLESKIITEMHRVISGKDLVTESTNQILLIQNGLRELDKETPKTTNS